MARGLILFILGGLVALITIVQLRGCGPTLGDQISEAICHRVGGAWESKHRICIHE